MYTMSDAARYLYVPLKKLKQKSERLVLSANYPQLKLAPL